MHMHKRESLIRITDWHIYIIILIKKNNKSNLEWCLGFKRIGYLDLLITNTTIYNFSIFDNPLLVNMFTCYRDM